LTRIEVGQPPKEAPEQPKDPTAENKPSDKPKTPTKVQITDVVVGKGAEAKDGRLAYVLYTGKLANGTVFDSNVGADKNPFAFPIGAGQVIKGWDEGILGLKVGGKPNLPIPSEPG